MHRHRGTLAAGRDNVLSSVQEVSGCVAGATVAGEAELASGDSDARPRWLMMEVACCIRGFRFGPVDSVMMMGLSSCGEEAVRSKMVGAHSTSGP